MDDYEEQIVSMFLEQFSALLEQLTEDQLFTVLAEMTQYMKTFDMIDILSLLCEAFMIKIPILLTKGEKTAIK